MSKTPETFNALFENAQTPAAEWRSAPFWALNGELKPEEIRKQIRGFRKNGLGGFYLHARTGWKLRISLKNGLSALMLPSMKQKN